MVEYDFYRNGYLGSVIPEKAFAEVMVRAVEAFERICVCYQVRKSGETSTKMALCAMAETIYTSCSRTGVSSATVGSVSVRYDTDGSMDKRLLQQARIYLDIYRGATACVAP